MARALWLTPLAREALERIAPEKGSCTVRFSLGVAGAATRRRGGENGTVAGAADIVVGDRQTDEIEHFSWVKRALQRWGSSLVRRASGTEVQDSTSGFRAMNRKAISTLFVHNKFSYTLETMIQAGNAGLVVANAKIRTNPKTRESKLFSSIPQYLRRNGPVIFRSYGMYWPMQTFGYIALGLLAVGLLLGGRFAHYYLTDPNTSSHIQSLQIGVGAIVLAFLVALMVLLSDLLAANRRLTEEVLARVRRLDATMAAHQRSGGQDLEGIHSTAARPWTPELRSRIEQGEHAQ
jgi:hypothetical protein